MIMVPNVQVVCILVKIVNTLLKTVYLVLLQSIEFQLMTVLVKLDTLNLVHNAQLVLILVKHVKQSQLIV